MKKIILSCIAGAALLSLVSLTGCDTDAPTHSSTTTTQQTTTPVPVTTTTTDTTQSR
jgi:hypothetical protein